MVNNYIKLTLDNTDRSIQNEHSRETDKTKTNKTKTQHKICWTPLYANKTNNHLSHQTIDHTVCIEGTKCIVSFSSYALYIVI